VASTDHRGTAIVEPHSASATGVLILAPAIRRRSHAARLSGGRRDEPDNQL